MYSDCAVLITSPQQTGLVIVMMFTPAHTRTHTHTHTPTHTHNTHTHTQGLGGKEGEHSTAIAKQHKDENRFGNILVCKFLR